MHGHNHLKAAEMPGVSWAPQGQSQQTMAARVHPISPSRNRQEVPGQPQSWSFEHHSEDVAGMWVHRWALLGRAHSQAGQGCGEVETSPVVGSLGQGLVVLRG